MRSFSPTSYDATPINSYPPSSSPSSSSYLSDKFYDTNETGRNWNPDFRQVDCRRIAREQKTPIHPINRIDFIDFSSLCNTGSCSGSYSSPYLSQYCGSGCSGSIGGHSEVTSLGIGSRPM